jgi:hypothetical protein
VTAELGWFCPTCDDAHTGDCPAGKSRLADDELIDVLREAFEVMEPVPQHVLDQGKAAFLQRCAMFPPHQPGTRPAHELRSGGVPVASRPDLLPSRAAVLDSTAPLGHQTADGAVHGDAPVPSAAQTAQVGGEADAASATAAGAAWVAGGGTPAHRNAAPARLKKAAAGLVAFALLAALAKALGIVAGDLLLLYLP